MTGNESAGGGERKGIRYERRGPLVRIVLDRPPLNVLDIATMTELIDCLEDAAGTEEVAVVFWTGAGTKAFSAGVEIREHTPDLVGKMLDRFHYIFRRMDTMDAVHVAAVRGHCLGGGMELATFCDLVIAAESAVFSQPEIGVGCFPPVAAAWLPGQIGSRRAAEITLLGRRYGARQALDLGLVNMVVPEGDLDGAADSLIEELLARSPAVLRLARRALRQGRPGDLDQRLRQVEHIYLDELCRTQDIQEGIEAFLEKRRPVWKGA